MESLNPKINTIHSAFCEAMGIDFVLLPPAERQWYEALKMGMTAEDVKLVVKCRKERIRAGIRHEECLRIRNIAGSEDAICNALEEVAAARAKLRVKVFSTGKAQALRDTGRADAPEQGPMRHISEVMQEMRKAAQ